MSSGRSNVALFAVVAAALVAQPARANETGPTMVVWAWHRNGSLESLSPDRFEVAFLARTLTLQSGGVAIAHRRSPVRVAPGTRLTAVVRIERDPALSADSAQRWLAETRDAVLGAHARAHAALQIDFDAPRSFRPFYRALLAQIRATLPRATRLSMTALGSWCTGDRWMHDLPADEIVPMLFAMGRGGAPVHRVLA
ncbi:MAG: hypothetical protein IT379_33615, partial [Deltaproteobacteria bacterium]|nr:hypothetical protein [Deltaproteobacteria bacterium]